ncbi:MAG: NADPH-dependent F420 reductase, partial [Gaiellaceae bacterium]
VMLGSRAADNRTAAEWVAATGSGASHGTFADAAAHGELVFNCTPGTVSLEANARLPSASLAGKTLVDVSNSLDLSGGFPVVVLSPTDSVAEQIQRAVAETHVVKALNTVNNEVMVDPGRVPGEHDLFVCGEDAAAKAEVVELLESFGWPKERIRDLGDLTGARALEAYLVLWLRLRGLVGSGDVNIRVVS